MRRGRVWLTLAAFPGADVVAFLRANGFRYHRAYGSWVHHCRLA